MDNGQPMANLSLFPERRVYTVSEFAFEAKNFLERQFLDIWVKGEICNFRRPHSGHFYFTLKDSDAQLKAVCFKTHNRYFKFKVEDGMNVLARARASLYETRGDFQLIVDYMEPAGTGTLQYAFEQLKQKLLAEGLFDAARKRPLPPFPRKLGVVTSPMGAAIQDILRILKRRNQQIHILIYPARVQGDGAAEEVAQGVMYLNTREDIDTIIVTRGGGPPEDLTAFNDEQLARVIVQSHIPVISAVGHEIDFTICDFVADLRAPTPSAAAEIVSATQDDLCRRIEDLLRRARQSLLLLIERKRSALERLAANRAFASAERRIDFISQRLDEISFRMTGAWRGYLARKVNAFEMVDSQLRHIDLHKIVRDAAAKLKAQLRSLEQSGTSFLSQKHQEMQTLAGNLHAYSPLAVLQRGYAIVRKENRQIVKSVRDVHIGEDVRVHLHQGELNCRIQGMKS
ncbi:MAG TPA: exodeoxyribonuclease VII large subunit [Acidobacteriota bacterium]|jgi:exodeoxyribonuclease VII large subunit|nr:exodeoxyribonuclease VII large subunit [Acidobacteriota bacterium]